MRVKIIDTTLTTNSAGQVVESLPVLPAEDRYEDAAGFWRDPIAMVEDANGTPIRIVDQATVLNSAGQPVTVARGEGVGAAAYASSPTPDGYHWEFATVGGTLVTQGGIPVVDLVRN